MNTPVHHEEALIHVHSPQSNEKENTLNCPRFLIRSFCDVMQLAQKFLPEVGSVLQSSIGKTSVKQCEQKHKHSDADYFGKLSGSFNLSLFTNTAEPLHC